MDGFGYCLAAALRTAIVTTVVEIRDDVRWLKQAVQAFLTHQGLTVAPDDTDD